MNRNRKRTISGIVVFGLILTLGAYITLNVTTGNTVAQVPETETDGTTETGESTESDGTADPGEPEAVTETVVETGDVLQLESPSVILMEPVTGQILYEKNADEQRHPASVTKVMTLLLIFDRLDTGKMNLTDTVTISAGSIEELLTNFNKECYMSIPEGFISITKDGVEDPSVKDVQLRDRIGKMRNEMFLGTAITGALSTVIGGTYFFLPALVTPALPVIAPVMVVLGIGSVLWGAISGNQKAKQETLQKNKATLLKHLSEMIAYCRKQIVDVSLADGKYQSLYQGFVDAAREQVKNTITNIYSKYSEELESMKKTVVESKNNPQLVLALEHLVKEWSKNKALIQDIHEKLETVKPE